MKNTLIITSIFTLSFCLNLTAQCWNLVFEDEFSGNSLDLSKWSYQTGASGWGNNELQNYTDRVDNVNITNGNLEIIAKEESFREAIYTAIDILANRQEYDEINARPLAFSKQSREQ